MCIVFRVEVEKHFASNHAVAEVVGACEASLFIYCEKSLHRTVYEVFVDHYGKRCGHADAVVGAESGAVGAEPVAVDDCAYGAVVKVEILVVALAYHVHVRLEHDCGSVLFAGSGGLEHGHVADSVGLYFDVVLGCEIKQILAYFFLFFGGTGHLVYFIENRENQRRFQVFNGHRCLCEKRMFLKSNKVLAVKKNVKKQSFGPLNYEIKSVRQKMRDNFAYICNVVDKNSNENSSSGNDSASHLRGASWH